MFVCVGKVAESESAIEVARVKVARYIWGERVEQGKEICCERRNRIYNGEICKEGGGGLSPYSQ